MKTITIRLPDVEATMLAELQKGTSHLRNMQGFLIARIKEKYSKKS
jgi:hypothetical protein